MTTILHCNQLTKSYGKTEAVSQLDLKLEENTIYGLLGRNGAGKTTLLNMISGGVFPYYGEITINGTIRRIMVYTQERILIRANDVYFIQINLAVSELNPGRLPQAR
jgi:ABC-2 type transport system ATP-binding protein